MINVIQNDEVYEITFPYDPDIIATLKNVPGRIWNPAGKMWTIPKDRLGFFINEFKGTKFEPMIKIISEEDINVNEEVANTTEIPDIDISGIPFYVKEGATPYKHQYDFMKWAIYRQLKGNMHGFILADDMGLSKTIESANLALYNKVQNKFKHCLVICCVNSAKYHWQDDIQQHTRGKEVPYILGTRLRRDGTERRDNGSKEKYEDLIQGTYYGKPDNDELPYFLILNIEAMRYKEGKRYAIRERLAELINAGEINMIILDEIHKNCLSYDTLVHTESGDMRIGDIVTAKLNTHVCSYNEVTGEVEWRPITNWFVNDAPPELVELTIETSQGIQTIRCTFDHLIHTRNRGWVPAIDLTTADIITEELLCQN